MHVIKVRFPQNTSRAWKHCGFSDTCESKSYSTRQGCQNTRGFKTGEVEEEIQKTTCQREKLCLRTQISLCHFRGHFSNCWAQSKWLSGPQVSTGREIWKQLILHSEACWCGCYFPACFELKWDLCCPVFASTWGQTHEILSWSVRMGAQSRNSIRGPHCCPNHIPLSHGSAGTEDRSGKFRPSATSSEPSRDGSVGQ